MLDMRSEAAPRLVCFHSRNHRQLLYWKWSGSLRSRSASASFPSGSTPVQFVENLHSWVFSLETVLFEVISLCFSFFSRCLFQDGKAMSDLPVVPYSIAFPVLKIGQLIPWLYTRPLGGLRAS